MPQTWWAAWSMYSDNQSWILARRCVSTTLSSSQFYCTARKYGLYRNLMSRSFHMFCQRRILGLRWCNFVTNSGWLRTSIEFRLTNTESTVGGVWSRPSASRQNCMGDQENRTDRQTTYCRRQEAPITIGVPSRSETARPASLNRSAWGIAPSVSV